MITEEQKQLIKTAILVKYSVGCDLPALAKEIEYNFIFGPEARNMHFDIDTIYSICLSVKDELEPKVNNDAII